MPEKEPQFFGKPETKEKPIERLQGFIREMSAKMREDGIPVNENGRINMDEFRGVHKRKVIELDKDWVRELKARWENAAVSNSRLSWMLSRERILQQKTMGEIWEMLATAILHKKLGEDFVVCRTSPYDDARNNIDGVIIDKKSGNIICAFDEVGADQGTRFEEKKRNILERNQQKGGGDLKYGIFFEGKGGKQDLKRGPIFHIPLFYFAMPKEEIARVLNGFSQKDVSPEEEVIFGKFVKSFLEQADYLKKVPLHPELRRRLEAFEALLRKLQKNENVLK